MHKTRLYFLLGLITHGALSIRWFFSNIWKGVEESGHGPVTLSLDVICSELLRLGELQIPTVGVGPMCGLHNYRKTWELT